MTDSKSRVGDDGDGVGVGTAADGGVVNAGAAVGGVPGSETEHCGSASLRALTLVQPFSQLRTARSGVMTTVMAT